MRKYYDPSGGGPTRRPRRDKHVLRCVAPHSRPDCAKLITRLPHPPSAFPTLFDFSACQLFGQIDAFCVAVFCFVLFLRKADNLMGLGGSFFRPQFHSIQRRAINADHLSQLSVDALCTAK